MLREGGCRAARPSAFWLQAPVPHRLRLALQGVWQIEDLLQSAVGPREKQQEYLELPSRDLRLHRASRE